MKELASTQKVLAFFYLYKLITIKYEAMTDVKTPTSENATKVAKTVTDANCKDFHYTQNELDEIQKRKDLMQKLDSGLRKYNGYY